MLARATALTLWRLISNPPFFPLPWREGGA
jgi:hypothetical protein